MTGIPHLTSLLEDLNRYTPQSYENNNIAELLDPKTLSLDLASTVTNDILQTDYEYVASLLFQPENGLLNFLRSNIYTKDSQSEVQTCIALASGGASSAVRVKALEMLIELVKYSASSDNTSMNVKDVYEKFSYEFKLSVSAVPTTVKGSIIELLGTITQYHADKIELIQTKMLARNCTMMLDRLLEDNQKPEHSCIVGVLNGLSSLLSNKRYDTNQLSIETKNIYKHLMAIIKNIDNLSRYALPLSAMSLFIDHARLFDVYFIQDYADIYDTIKKICAHINRDLSKMGYRVLESFFKKIGPAVAKNDGVQEKAALKYFMAIFVGGLNQELDELDFQTFSISVRGIGYFAEAAKRFMGNDELESLQEQLIKKGNWLCSEISADEVKLAIHLPSFIQAYSQFIQQCTVIQPALMSIICKMTDAFVLHYGGASMYGRRPGIFAIQFLIKILFVKGEGLLRQYLASFFYTSLISTCNAKGTAQGVLNDEFMTGYKELIYFWSSILTNQYFPNTTTHNDDDGDNGDKKTQQIQAVLYDELLSSVLRMVKALDLNVKAIDDDDDNEHDDTTLTPVGADKNQEIGYFSNLAPVNQKDFILYQNLVGFWCTLLPRLDNQRLPEWIGIAGTALIEASLQNPLVSGFYRMLATTLAITKKMRLFDGCKERNITSIKGPAIKTPVDEAYVIFYDYMHQVWHKMKQFKDELLVSCLRLILACPLDFFDIGELVPPLQIAVRYGLSYYPMATLALNTLEHLVDVDSPTYKAIQDDPTFLQSILPLFNEYLMMDLVSEDDTKQQNVSNKKFRAATRTSRLREKIHRKLSKDELGDVEDEDLAIGLRDIQLRLMRFLGHLGGANKYMLHQSTGDLVPQDDYVERTSGRQQQHQLLAWDPDRQLTIHVPFPNAGIQLPMDELLPHICALAESSPDRKIKVASGEFLHGLVLVMIGNSAFQARDRRGAVVSRYHQLYQHVFPVLIRLSVDLDQVTRDMFQSLVAQIIHWLTNNAQYENPETILLLQTCLEAACSTQAALRDYGASCVYEFVKWSIKQTSAQATHSPMNIKSLLKRLYHLTTHPSAAKRLGASMIFNNIYRLFREEQSLVNEYTLELLYHFMFSMRLSENDHPSLGTQQKTRESISHLKRIIRVKSSLFLTESSVRRPFPGADHTDLQTVVEWCFQETGRIEREYAKTCMEFFSEFVLILPDTNNAQEWLAKKIAKEPDYLMDVYHTSSFVPLSPTTYHGRNESSSTDSSSRLDWLKQLGSTLDAYVWLLERNVLTLSNCAVLEKNQHGFSLADICVSFMQSDIGGGENETLNEQLQVKSFKAYNSFRIVCLLNALLESLPSNEIGNNVSKVVDLVENMGLLTLPGFASLITSMLLLPHHLAAVVQSGHTSLSSWINIKKVRSAGVCLLQFVKQHWVGSHLKMFCSAIAEGLSAANITAISSTVHQGSLQDIMEVLNGVKYLQRLDLLDRVCVSWYKLDSYGGSSSADSLCATLFNQSVQMRNNDDPNIITLSGKMIQLAFGQPGFAEMHALELLGYMDNGEVNPDIDQQAIYQRHSEDINSCIALNFQHFIPFFIKNLDNDFIKQVIVGLLDHLKFVRNTNVQEIKHFSHHLIASPLFLDEIRRQWNTVDDYSTLVAVMKGIFGANGTIFMQAKPTPVCETFVAIMEQLLDRVYPLTDKNEAFDLLPFFLQVEGPHTDRISISIKAVINTQFPLSFSDLNPSSLVYNESMAALKSLLNIMATFHSVIIFNVLMPTFMQDNGQLYQEVIAPSISIFANGLSLSSFMKIAQTTFSYFMDTTLYSGHRIKAMELMVSILFLVPRDYVISFYEANIVDIMTIIKQEELRRGTDDEIAMDLSEKASCFRLMQVLYELLPSKQVHSPESKISGLWEKSENKPSQGRKMTIDLVSQAHQAKSKRHPLESENLAKARLAYQQAAYNAAAASILRTQKSEKFFVGFLFQEKPSEPLWENLLDPSTKLDLPVELTQPLLKTRLEQFGRNFTQRTKDIESTAPVFMASVGLIGSSLSQPSLSEVALDTLGQKESSTQRAIADDQMDIEGENMESEAESGTTIRDSTELELDQFNANPCMKLLGAVVQRLHSAITPPDENPTDMPLWMAEIHKAFTSHDSSLLQQLFLAKMIINSPEVFERYAQFWLRPLIQLAMRGNEYGQPINYFVQDICVLIIAWGKTVTLQNNHDDRYLLYKFVNYLVSHSYHTNSQVLRNNIQILKSVFENWNKLIIVPTKSIFLELSTNDTQTRRNLSGLQIAGLVLAYGHDIFYDGPEVDMTGLDEPEFYRALFGNMKNRYTEVVCSAAEVISWSLTEMKKRNRDDNMVTEIENHLSHLISKYDTTDTDLFLSVMYRLHLHDDNLCRPSLPKILYMLPSLTEQPLINALEIISGCVDESTNDAFIDLKGKGLLKIINLRNDGSQLAILKLMNKIAPSINVEQAQYFFGDLVAAFTGHSSQDCRDQYYTLLQILYDNYQDIAPFGDEIKLEMLRGLVDNSDDIRNNVGMYLRNKFGITNDIYQRTKIILKDMFMPPIENMYISYATQMLLQTTTDSYEYDKPLFNRPLPNAHFDDHVQHIDTSWRRNLSMAPLFVASQEQHSASSAYLENQLRQTQQSLEFSQTQAGAGSSLMSTFAEPSIPSTLMATSQGSTQSPASQRENDDQTRQSQYNNLRRRYVRSSPESTTAFFRRRHDRMAKNLQKFQALQKQQREKKVVMHRKYRVGELPDIQIKYSELIEPLQALGRSDQTIASILYTQLVVGIGSNAESSASKEDYKSDIVTTIDSNLNSSILFFPPTIGSFLRVFFELGGQNMSSDLIKVVSERSFNHHLGIAVLEKQIEKGTSTQMEKPAKRTRYEGSTVKLPASLQEWIDLATLYQDIDEPEIFQSIYRTHVASKDLPKRAVDAEIRGDIALSCNLFQEAMETHYTETAPEEYNLWAKEGLRCFEQLTQWDDVSFHVSNDLGGEYTKLWDKNYLIPYLHYFLRSNTKLREGILDENNNLVPWTATNPNPVYSFVNESIQSKEKLEYMIEHHAAEISMATINMNDLERAGHYIRQSFESFHSIWTSLHPLSKTSRMKRLSLLQKNIEIEDFLDMVGNIQRNDSKNSDISHYIRTLQSRYPDPKLDGMDLWDDVIDSRTVFLNVISKVSSVAQTNETIKDLLATSQKHFMTEMISAARQQNNFNVAISRWQSLADLGNVEAYQRNYAYINIELQRCMASDDQTTRAKLMARTLGSVFGYKLPGSVEAEDTNFTIDYHLTASKVLETSWLHLQDYPSSYQAFVSNKQVNKHFSQRQFNDVTEFASQLTMEGYNHLLSACAVASEQSSSLEAECAWKFGDYCDNALRANENSSESFSITINSIQYSKVVVNNFFRAIELGQQKAVERFPRLLELIERYPSTGDDFKTHAQNSSVTWNYIRWIPQLVAILDKPTARYVFPLVLKLAQEYPAALYYPFQLSNEHYECYKEQLDTVNREAIAQIKETIKSPLMETFTGELRRLTNPEHIVKDFLDFIMSLGQKVDVNNTFLDDSYQQFCDLLLDPTNSKLGTIPKAFAVKHASQLREILGKNGSKIRTMSDRQRAKLMKYYQTNIQNQKLPGAPELLKSYSPWLSSFQSTNFKEQIEIPGQYNGRSKPDPESHVKIASFDERLLVMGSLRKPKRLRIYGTDGNESLFLVKGGEDLRLDQRIQQLFTVMNELIRKEPYCAKHDVTLTTYNVIPMATNIGMIEWVQDTKPLRNCIEDQLNNKGLALRIQENYRIFVSKFKGEIMGYHNLFKAPRDTVVRNFLQQTGSFRDNILKEYLMKLAASPEAFIFMRNNFAHSLGAICIAGYLLGIGDRHLENILVDKKRGTLLAIDFGHAFGSATELLPVPEMMPFRLTRQLVGALEPLGIKGILEVIMIHILEAIQMEKQVILNVMDVFVKEPLLDWKKIAAKQAKVQKSNTETSSNDQGSNASDFLAGSNSSTSTNEEYEWYPQQKIETARKKLDGFNPTEILLEELEHGHSGKSYLKGLQKVVKGEEGINIRATTGQKCQNSLEQVQCLIDLATDPNILGRTWAGWQSFI
ncbi:unnamed protein product [Absidia cylindrospora]